MRKFFEYNWHVRDEWFEWCKQLSKEELNKKRCGGVESILHTLFHITEVEYSWLRGIQRKEDIQFEFRNYETLEKVQLISDELRDENAKFLYSNFDMNKMVSVPWDKAKYTIDEILHHIVAHEIHHIGQLSIWARELNLAPIQAHFIGRRIDILSENK